MGAFGSPIHRSQRLLFVHEMETVLQVLIDGILSGLLYALVAAGLCLIWGVMDVINFAHGEFLMVAMYVSYWLGFLAGVDPLVSVLAAGAFVFLLGVLTYQLIVKYTVGKPPLAALLATFGLAMLIKNFCLNRFSPNFRILSDTWLGDKTYHLGALIIPIPQLVTGILALVVIGLVYALINSTRFGWAVQATAMDKEAAELMGINTERIYGSSVSAGRVWALPAASCRPILPCIPRWARSSGSLPSSAWPWGDTWRLWPSEGRDFSVGKSREKQILRQGCRLAAVPGGRGRPAPCAGFCG